MKIEIWSDFACPFCYIGKKRFERALANFEHKDDVQMVFKAYQLNPNSPKTMTGTAAEAFAKSHNSTVDQAKARFRMFAENAKTVGLTYDYDKVQMTNTFDAHRLAKWAGTLQKEDVLTDRLMKAYFTEGQNLADLSVLKRLAGEVGLDQELAATMLENGTYGDVVKSEIAEARKIGVQGVPFFVVNRKYGISGAQEEAYFAAALEQIWGEDHPLQTLEGESDAHTCDDDSCSI
jgi:predicted DsbA family dithiol-disulfide isomerase